MSGAERPVVAFLPWGDVFEDFHDTIGVSIDRFAASFSGSFQFNLIRALDRAGVDTVLVQVSTRVRQTRRLVHAPTGCRVVLLPATRRFRALRRLAAASGSFTVRTLGSYGAVPLFALAREIRAASCRAILVQEYETPRFDLAVAIGGILGIPVHATFQGGNRTLSAIEWPARALAVARAAGFVIPVAAEAERMRRAYGVEPGRIAPIFNPVDADSWTALPREQARRSLDLPDPAFICAWHGRIAYRPKGLDVLLASWPLVRAAVPGALLVLVGGGPDAERLRHDAAALGAGRVVWRESFVHDRDEIRRWLSAADLYVFPSRHEGFPVAPLEAMAVGLPLAAADASGVREILGDSGAGVVIPRDDPAALARAIVAAAADPAWRHRAGGAARARIEQAFTLERVGGQLRRHLLDEDR